MATKKKAAKKKAVKPKMQVVNDDQIMDVPFEENGHERPKVDKATTQRRTITHVRLQKEKHLTVTCNCIESDGATPQDTKDYFGRPVHDDLQAAFNALSVHMGLITEDISVQHVKPIDEYPQAKIDKFVVQGLHIKDSKKGTAYILTGYKKLSKDVLPMNTPKRLKDENEDTRYGYMDNLIICVEHLLKEVALYESGEKVGTPQQTAMDFENDSETDLNAAFPVDKAMFPDEEHPYVEEGI